MRYLVITADKNTGQINCKHIDATSYKDSVIEEYLDSIGETFWAVYPPTVPEEAALKNFDDYLKCRN